jgi:hypothetical protein
MKFAKFSEHYITRADALYPFSEALLKAKLQNLAGYDSRCPTSRAKVQI